MLPSQAAAHTLHYLSHISDGWAGYSLDDAAEAATNVMAEFLTGGLTVEADLLPLCDEWCL
jgi:hypothetical protein